MYEFYKPYFQLNMQQYVSLYTSAQTDHLQYS